jgi:2-isopropylmalate synthase
MSENSLIIFDTTLRDGEQSPGASMNLAEKLEIAHALKELGVDIIEAGFPIASPGDFEAVREIARQVQGPIICGLARCNPEDIDRAWEALQDAPRRRIHVFLATSAIHREFKLRMAKEEIVRRAVEALRRIEALRCARGQKSIPNGAGTRPSSRQLRGATERSASIVASASRGTARRRRGNR